MFEFMLNLLNFLWLVKCGADFMLLALHWILCQIYWTSITYYSVHPFVATLTLSNLKWNWGVFKKWCFIYMHIFCHTFGLKDYIFPFFVSYMWLLVNAPMQWCQVTRLLPYEPLYMPRITFITAVDFFYLQILNFSLTWPNTTACKKQVLNIKNKYIFKESAKHNFFFYGGRG